MLVIIVFLLPVTGPRNRVANITMWDSNYDDYKDKT